MKLKKIKLKSRYNHLNFLFRFQKALYKTEEIEVPRKDLISTLKESISRYYDDLRAGIVEFKKPESDKEKGGKDN